MDKKLDISETSIAEKKLFAKAFETFNSSIEKLRLYQMKLEGRIQELTTELHVKNRELTNILQSLSTGLVVTSLDGKIKIFNRATSAITGISEEEAKGKKLNELMGFEILPSEVNEEALQTIEEGLNCKFQYKKLSGQKESGNKSGSEGELITLEGSTTLMRSEADQNLGVIVNLTDVTMIDRLKEDAERKRRLAAMGEIAMQVAHEVRNPLGSIELFVSMMKKDALEGSEELDLMEHVLSATRSMNHIISNLLEYTRPKPIGLDIIEVHDLLKEFVKFSQHFANSQSIEIHTDLGAEESHIKGNKELLKQVFLNIFMNGTQAMDEEGGDFTVSTVNYNETDPIVLKRFTGRIIDERGLDLFRITFKDTGKGMSEEVRSKLFEPFYTTREQGTGLGMSIVHKTLASHGGVILVTSKLGEGTSLHLLFPQVTEQD